MKEGGGGVSTDFRRQYLFLDFLVATGSCSRIPMYHMMTAFNRAEKTPIAMANTTETSEWRMQCMVSPKKIDSNAVQMSVEMEMSQKHSQEPARN
jgi:hypothetical protein